MPPVVGPQRVATALSRSGSARRCTHRDAELIRAAVRRHQVARISPGALLRDDRRSTRWAALPSLEVPSRCAGSSARGDRLARRNAVTPGGLARAVRGRRRRASRCWCSMCWPRSRFRRRWKKRLGPRLLRIVHAAAEVTATDATFGRRTLPVRVRASPAGPCKLANGVACSSRERAAISGSESSPGRARSQRWPPTSAPRATCPSCFARGLPHGNSARTGGWRAWLRRRRGALRGPRWARAMRPPARRDWLAPPSL